MNIKEYLQKAEKIYHRKPSLFKTLSPQQEKALRMRLGLGKTGIKCSYKDIGHHFAVSGQQARNIVTDALVHLGLNSLTDEEDS